MVKEIFEKIGAERGSETAAAVIMSRFNEVSTQAEWEQALAAIRNLNYREIGIDREGAIGRHHKLKERVRLDQYDEDDVYAVIVRELCRRAILRKIHELLSRSKRSRKFV